MEIVERARQKYAQTESRVVRNLPEGDRVCGLTILEGRLYVLRCRDEDQVEAYDNEFCLLRKIFLPRLYRDDWNDMTSCSNHRCLYVSNYSMNRIQKVDTEGMITLWPMPNAPCGLSMTRDDHLLVTFHATGMVAEFNKIGECVREILLQADVPWPWHAVSLAGSTTEYVVCNGYYTDHLHRVCHVDVETGGSRVRSYGGSMGSDVGHLYVPYHLAVDGDGLVFVADHHNGRVVLLGPHLEFICCFASHENGLRNLPRRLYIDEVLKRLFVGQDDGSIAIYQL